MLHRIGGSVFAIAACLAFSGSAGAADLGGDCCADLEERVAELEATTARKGNRKVSLTVYGEINQAVMWWDDSTESNVYVVTNSTTENKLGFEGSAKISSDWSAGYRLELEIRTAESDFIDQGGPGGVLFDGRRTLTGLLGDEGSGGIVVRHSYWWLESRQLGRVSVGQQSDATDGIAEIDLSGAVAAGGSAVETWNEGFALRDKTTGEFVRLQFSGFPFMVSLFQGNLDGGRGNFVRYDSPVIGGFILSAAWGEVEPSTGLSRDDHDWSVALRYAGQFAGFQIAAGLGYREGVTLDSDNFILLDPARAIVGSASVLHEPTGLFATVAAGRREFAGALDSTTYYYLKGGVFQRWLPVGKTSIYGEYYHTEVNQFESGTIATVAGVLPASAFDEDADMWGVGVVQHVDAAAMELYLSYRHYWADNITDVDFGTDHSVEFDAVMSGARIKF